MTNNKLLKSSVGIIILSVVIIMIANIMLKVDKPVFLENYCEYPLSYYKDPSYNGSYCEQLFTLKYITNVNDKKTVTEIQFDGLGENNYAYASEYEPFGNWMYYDAGELNETIYGIYSVREVTVQLMLYFEKEPLDNIVINSATVYFSDGSQQQVNLGEIIFYYEKGLDEAINFKGSFSSSNGDFTADGEALRDITISRIYSPLFKYCHQYIDLYLSGISYLEVSDELYKANENIIIKGKFYPPENVKGRYTIYQLAPKIYYINEKGEKWYIRGQSISYEPYEFKFLDIIKYLKVLEEI